MANEPMCSQNTPIFDLSVGPWSCIPARASDVPFKAVEAGQSCQGDEIDFGFEEVNLIIVVMSLQCELVRVQFGQDVEEDVRDRDSARQGEPTAPGYALQEPKLAHEQVNQDEDGDGKKGQDDHFNRHAPLQWRGTASGSPRWSIVSGDFRPGGHPSR